MELCRRPATHRPPPHPHPLQPLFGRGFPQPSCLFWMRWRFTPLRTQPTQHMANCFPAQHRCAPRCKGGQCGRPAGFKFAAASVATSQGREFGCKYCLWRGRARRASQRRGCELVSACEQGRASKVIPEGGKKGSRGFGGKTSSSIMVENSTW